MCFVFVCVYQTGQNVPAASEQARLREKSRLVQVWYSIDRKYAA